MTKYVKGRKGVSEGYRFARSTEPPLPVCVLGARSDWFAVGGGVAVDLLRWGGWGVVF